MDHSEIIRHLEEHMGRLSGEVVEAFRERGSSYGDERFAAWRNRFGRFLDDKLPGESSRLNAKLTHHVFVVRRGESDLQRFWREDGETAHAFIESLVLDLRRGEYQFRAGSESSDTKKRSAGRSITKPHRVFIVHGHDELTTTKTARFVEKLGFDAVILREQVNGGDTVIEKIEAHTDVDFAIVLYTPDDKGNDNKSAVDGKLNARARQNVIFEHGFLIGKLGRKKVVPLVQDASIELPSDLSGVVYVSSTDWQIAVAKEMKNVGYPVDFNKLV